MFGPPLKTWRTRGRMWQLQKQPFPMEKIPVGGGGGEARNGGRMTKMRVLEQSRGGEGGRGETGERAGKNRVHGRE